MGTKALPPWPKNLNPTHVLQLIRAERDTLKALLIFDSATAEYSNGYRHDHNTFSLIISRLASANQFASADSLLTRMKQENCPIPEDTFLSICQAYGRAHKPLEALKTFHSMKDFNCEPTQKSFLSLFDILVSENRLKLAHKFFFQMKEMGIPLSLVSLNILLKALCKSQKTIDSAFRVFKKMELEFGFTPDSYTYGTLIDGLCKLGRVSEAKPLMEEMISKKCSPTVITYSTMIYGFCKVGDLETAMKLLEEMVVNGIEPNVITYTSLINGLCKAGRSLEAMEVLETMDGKREKAKGGKREKPNMKTYSTLLTGLCTERRIHEALCVFDQMKLHGWKPDAALYSKIVTGLCQFQRFEEAANFLDEMVLSGVKPNSMTQKLHENMHNLVIRGLCSSMDTNRAFQGYMGTRTRGIQVVSESFRVMVGGFCKKGDVYKAARLVREMVDDGFAPDESVWQTIVSGFWERRKVREAAEELQGMLEREFL